MGKFKVGDRVRVCASHGWTNGSVVAYYKDTPNCSIIKVPDGQGWAIGKSEVAYYKKACGAILETGRNCYWNADEKWLKLPTHTENDTGLSKRRVVIEITDDGAEAKYIVGKNIEKTASIKRHPEDEPNDEIAAVYSIAKLFGENLRAMEDKVDGKIEMFKDALGWIYGAKEALGEAEKRIMKLI